MDVILKKYFWVLNLVAIALCAGLGGAAAAHLIEQSWLIGAEESQQQAAAAASRPRPLGGPSEKVHAKDDELVIKRNVFCSTCAPVKPEEAKEGEQSHELVKSSLPLELVATMWVDASHCGDRAGCVVRGDPEWSMAVIRDTASKAKDAHAYNAGKTIDGMQVTVARVDPKKVWLKNNGRYEYLEIEGEAEKPKVASVDQPPPAAPGASGLDADVQRSVRCNGSQCDVDRSLIDKLLSNTTELATSARFVPSVKDGRPNGFKLYAIRPSSIFGKIGLQNGDTVKQINGMEMSSPDQALAVYSKLRTASHLTVSLERRGETITLDYTIR